jgi:trans-aconitate methyltransferase
LDTTVVSATGHRRENGALFDDVDVARCYAYRAPYAPALYEFLLSLVRGRERALDLGCGPGKIARQLAPHFASVTAIDPAAPMIAVGKENAPANIQWVCAPAETASFGCFDLATAGASMHWMKHDVVFPKLAEGLAPSGIVAVIDGDGAVDVPWAGEMEQFLIHWLARVGRTYSPATFKTEIESNRPWLDLLGERSFRFEHSETIEGLIEREHSRATWTRAVLGPALTREFDADLERLYAPFESDGRLTYTVKSTLVWGMPRMMPRI